MKHTQEFTHLDFKIPQHLRQTLHKSISYYFKKHIIQDLILIMTMLFLMFVYYQVQMNKPIEAINIIHGIVEKTSAIASHFSNKNIVITKANGDQFEFSISPETVIYGKSWKPYTTNPINLNDKIKIQFVKTNNGDMKVTAITIKK
ncbi:MAG: hypothetical protein A2Y40_07435 [Candidatus Margulisbacteria bacterium GWF2_35_9]|nr:MAG: hypothetical protein A2Y40_07435 [Candidatus Margulisbacteria bacterium GWF2_35_9]